MVMIIFKYWSWRCW